MIRILHPIALWFLTTAALASEASSQRVEHLETVSPISEDAAKHRAFEQARAWCGTPVVDHGLTLRTGSRGHVADLWFACSDPDPTDAG